MNAPDASPVRIVGGERVDDRPLPTGFAGTGHVGALSAPAASTTEVTFDVLGAVVPWSRPRFNGLIKRVFNDSKIRSYEKLVAAVARSAMAGRPVLTGPVMLDITVVMPVPASWSKRRQRDALDGLIKPTSKPDWDNAAKGIVDAICGVVIRDDTQVVRATVEKAYGATPRASVAVGAWAAPR